MVELLAAAGWWPIAAAAVGVTLLVVWWSRRGLAGRAASASRLHGGYLVATVIIAAVALVLITIAFIMSYAALYASATWLADTQLEVINGGDLRFLFPLGIDAVIVYFLAMDLVMEWQGRRHPLNRWAAYALSVITIILNVSQGDGSTASYLGHAGPPIVIILIAEGVAAWIRHLAGLAHGQAADRIPAGRWVAHPVSTLKVARLMLGWGISSYPEALAREQRRQLAYAMLRHQYGRTWRRHTPRHLRWMLDNGYELDTAYELTRALTVETVAMSAAEVDRLATPGGHGRTPVATGREAAGGTPEHVHPSPNVDHPDDHTTADMAAPAPANATSDGHPHTGAFASPVPGAAPVLPAGNSQVGAGTGTVTPPPPQGLNPEQKRRRVRELLTTHPGISDAQIAHHIGASPRTARRYRNELAQTVSDTDPAGHGQPAAANGQDTPSPNGQRLASAGH